MKWEQCVELAKECGLWTENANKIGRIISYVRPLALR